MKNLIITSKNPDAFASKDADVFMPGWAIPEHEFDTITLHDSIDWYINHRFEFKGNPFLIVTAFSGSEIHHIYPEPSILRELNVLGCITSCLSYASYAAPDFPTVHAWPVTATSDEVIFIGSVIDGNCVNRDFSGLIYVWERLSPALKSRFKVVARSEEGKPSNLPFEVQLYDGPQPRVIEYIPVPHCESVACHLVDPEVIAAVKSGSHILGAGFYNLEYFYKQFKVAESLKDLDAAVRHLNNGRRFSTLKVPDSMSKSNELFFTTLGRFYDEIRGPTKIPGKVADIIFKSGGDRPS